MNALSLVKPGRTICGNSAILLPYTKEGNPDWSAFSQHVVRSLDSGLAPAINMDTGYGPWLADSERREALSIAKNVSKGKRFLAGAFVRDEPGSSFDLPAYEKQIEPIREFGGVPVIMQSYGISNGDRGSIVSNYQQIAEMCDEFIAFELGKQFADFGCIYDLDVFCDLMMIPNCSGAKHSSLNRQLELNRLSRRDSLRPDFHIYTGNDLAIDMVMYGSDYLLGLSTFAPEAFAARDRLWADEHVDFYELNDVLQYLGAFAFRDPVPAYKHSAAQFLHLRNWIASDRTHSKCPQRPATDVEILTLISDRLQQLTASAS